MKIQTVRVAFQACACLLASPVSAQDGAAVQITDRVTQWREEIAQWISLAGEDHMSPMGMYLAADVVVQAVMVSLAIASVLVWAVFLAKVFILLTARNRLRRNYRKLEKLGTLELSPETFAKRRGVMGAMVRAAVAERIQSGGASAAGIKERTESALSRIEAGAARGMGAGTSVLAITGSTAPFIGLFGTVWGIMNSFVSIAETNTTNLAVVAPGIAEALLATAIGLVAAIPAVIFYNLLARSIGGYRVMLADASALVQRTLSRDLDLSVGQQFTPTEETHLTVGGEDAPRQVIQQAAE